MGTPRERLRPANAEPLTIKRYNQDRNTALSVIAAVLGAIGLAASTYIVTGKNVPEDSVLGQELAPLAQKYEEQAAQYNSFGAMYAAYQAPQGVDPTEYRTPLEKIGDQRRTAIETHGCTDKSDWTVGEPDFGSGIHHMVATMDTRVNIGCKVN